LTIDNAGLTGNKDMEWTQGIQIMSTPAYFGWVSLLEIS
jgi:hypothetical protein